jgi:hypothetical protein
VNTGDVRNSDWVDRAVRFGMVAYGVVHLVIAWLAIQLALGDHEGSASSSGAMHELAQQPFGSFVLWLVTIGMLLLVLWRLLEATAGHRDEDGNDRLRKRLGSAAKAVIYGSIGFSALQVAIGSGSSGGGSSSTTAKIMDLPGGQILVGAVALGIIGYGANQVRRSFTEKFREHLSAEGKSGEAGTAYIWLGKAGYFAKGIAIILVGGLVGYAAITHDAQKSGGLDQALRTVLRQPFGPYLLAAMAVGIGCYGLFCFARARHLSR